MVGVIGEFRRRRQRQQFVPATKNKKKDFSELVIGFQLLIILTFLGWVGFRFVLVGPTKWSDGSWHRKCVFPLELDIVIFTLGISRM